MAPADRAALETGLFEHGRWNLDQLAVYADHLHAEGDPRGELILLDLDGGPEVADRRRELLELLLGEHAANPAIRCRFGFVEVELDERSDRLLVSRLGPLGGYLREVRVIGTSETIPAAIETLAGAPRRWLTELAIRRRRVDRRPTIVGVDCRALALATPRLDTLDIHGDAVFASFEHDTLRVLRLADLDGIRSLEGGTDVLPGVRELDLLIRGAGWSDDDFVRHLQPRSFPGLVRLDLSRNDPWGSPDLSRLLRSTPLAAQITELRLPPALSANDQANLPAVLDGMPRLHRIEMPRGLLRDAHASAAIVERPHPWHAGTRPIAGFDVGGAMHYVALGDAAAWLDDHYDQMPGVARAAWDHVWDVLVRARLGPERSRSLLLEQLVRALDACHGHVWRVLHDALRTTGHGPGVVLPLL